MRTEWRIDMAAEDLDVVETTQGLRFNGINGATGEYLLPTLRARQVAQIAAGEPLDAEELAELRKHWLRASQPHFAPMAGIDAQDLSKAGWGIVYAPDVTQAEKEALSPLLQLRKDEAQDRYQDFAGERAYRIGDTKYSFLARSGAGPGAVDPRKIPYYLLLVGNPKSIPYRFQYQLDVQHAVGRLHFESKEQYATYAETVVKAEKSKVLLPRQVTFFGVRNRADMATQLSADQLIKPLLDLMQQQEPDWEWRCVWGAEALKVKLAKLLGGEETPSLLVSASHGVAFPNGDPRQIPHQGALLCQDWPGPLKHKGTIPEGFYFAADDILDAANLQGLIAFFFACYSGGTPQLDDFPHLALGQGEIAPYPFVASLPKRLLGHPKGGALAVIGHVERAWSYSFLWERAGKQLAVFESAISELVNGRRVGSAMEYFNMRYSELSTDITEELKDRKARRARPESETVAEDEALAGMWTANNDARSYVVLGDPAVRLPSKPISP
jgi:hypothetical protein